MEEGRHFATSCSESIFRVSRWNGPESAPPGSRTTTYGTPPEQQVHRSFGATPLAETLNPPVRDAGLRRPSKLLRPAALAT